MPPVSWSIAIGPKGKRLSLKWKWSWCLAATQAVNQDANRCGIGTNHMNATRLMWTGLMCSRNRQKLETLQSRLSKAGIPSEIRFNSVAANGGIVPVEILVDERDLFRASKICQGLETGVSANDAAGSPGGGRAVNGFVKSEESEPVTEAEVLPSPSTESPREENPGPGAEAGRAEPEGEFAQATAPLEKQVEELLAAESKLIDRCSSLEAKVKTLDESLAASQARLESQTREFGAQQARIANLEKHVSSRDTQLEGIAVSLAKARAGIEQEKELRLAAEQESGELAAALKAVECQLAQQARQREQLLNERRDEQEQMRVCVGRVNALSSRVSAALAAREKQ
jgi:hypothetical protein